jgi:predicted dienelactone hydrolase
MFRLRRPILILLLLAAAAGVSCADTLRPKGKGRPPAKASQVEPEAPPGKDPLVLTQGSNVGYTVYRLPTKDQDGKPVTTSLAVWYPTTAPETDFTYFYGTASTKTRLAQDAPASEGRFPLVLYSHGAAAGGLAGAYITETLARRGYVVATIDHTDEAYFSRITDDGSSQAPRGGLLYATKIYSQYLKSPKSKDRRGDIMFRPLQLKDAIAFLVEQDKTKGSTLFGHIETDSIGLIGHSFGAWTVLMEAGVDPRFSDGRIRAVVSLSCPSNENIFQPGELARIKVPVMFMYGEKEVAIGRSGDKQFYFDRANAPKYMIEVADADHLSFGRDKKLATLSDHLTKDHSRAGIARYALAFMDLYLKSDAAAKAQLQQKGEGVRTYTYEAAELPKLE